MAEFVGFALIPFDFASLPPSDTLPQGRVVGVGRGGIVYSDDDGVTWVPTALVQKFNIVARSVTQAPNGLLYAAANGNTGSGPPIGGVFESAGGVSWERVGTVPGDNSFGYKLVAVTDAALYAIGVGDIDYDVGATVYRSLDAGRTWASVGPVWTDWDVRLNDLALGPEGRLWVATTGRPGPDGIGGVFRTPEPVFTVANEGTPGEASALRLRAYPNPTGASANVVLTLPTASDARVVAYDVLGREVAVLHDGPLAAGMHRFRFDGARLTPGTYVLRTTAGEAVATSHVTLVH